MAITLEVREDKQTCWTCNMRNGKYGTAITGGVGKNLVLLSAQELAGQEILDFGEFARLLPVSRWEADAYYLPAARSGIMQSHRVIARSLVRSATRVGVDRFREIPTFSGMIADFLEQIIGYEDRNGDWDEMIGIANLLEMEVLRGKIEVKTCSGRGISGIPLPPQGYSAATAYESIVVNGIGACTVGAVSARYRSSGRFAHY